MIQPFAALITSFVITYLITPLVIKYLFDKQIVVTPGRRKIHKVPKPSLGGLAIFIGFLISSLICINVDNWKLIKFILIAQTVIVLIGVRDDLIPLKPLYKLGGQIIAAAVIIFLFDIRIHSLYGFFGLYEINSFLSYALTFFALIGITNSYNLIDGLDGLAGTIASIAFFTFGVWFFLADDQMFSVLSFAMLGGLIAFLSFNWQPSSIFMGDTGSLFIGLTMAIVTIHFMNTNFSLPDSHPVKFANTIGMASSILVVLLVDTSRIVILRLAKGQSPFSPDKNHIHHAISRLGMSHSKTTIILASVQVLYITLGIMFHAISDTYFVPGIVVLSIALSIYLDRLINNKLA